MIYFHSEDVSFRLKKSAIIKSWLRRVIHSHKKKTGNINFIFCSDEYLLVLNRKYLNHDAYTDIITFDNSTKAALIEGDIFISIVRVKENAQHLKVDFENELHRVMVHGVLHLLGYDDQKKSSQKEMRKKEDECLKML